MNSLVCDCSFGFTLAFCQSSSCSSVLNVLVIIYYVIFYVICSAKQNERRHSRLKIVDHCLQAECPSPSADTDLSIVDKQTALVGMDRRMLVKHSI